MKDFRTNHNKKSLSFLRELKYVLKLITKLFRLYLRSGISHRKTVIILRAIEIRCLKYHVIRNIRYLLVSKTCDLRLLFEKDFGEDLNIIVDNNVM